MDDKMIFFYILSIVLLVLGFFTGLFYEREQHCTAYAQKYNEVVIKYNTLAESCSTLSWVQEKNFSEVNYGVSPYSES